MRSIIRLPAYALVAGMFLASAGCVVDADHDRAYRHHSAEYREHERQEAYRHCVAAGEHDCDDLLHHY